MQKTPFHDESGKIQFPWEPITDNAFIYRLPTPEKFNPTGTVLIPDILKEYFQPGLGILLAIGPGYFDKKGKYYPTPEELKPGVLVSFDPNVPWFMAARGVDGRFYKVVVCRTGDILGIVEEE